MVLPSLRLAAAKYSLLSHGQSVKLDLQEIADKALTHGLYSDALGELYTNRPPYRGPRLDGYEAHRLFGSALKELGIPIPSPEDATRILLQHYVRCIIERTQSPRETIERIRQEVDGVQYASSNPYAEPSLGVREFRDYYHAYWDLEMDSDILKDERAALDRRVIEHAEKWHQEHCRAGLDPSWLAWNDGTVRKIAQAIHEEKSFDVLPILADALEDAGCADEEILEHCRECAEHVRCCWVVEHLLGWPKRKE